MEEKMVPGDYTALVVVNIRAQMKTDMNTSIMGGYRNGETFRVYEVYSEVNGIVWGRVSSNTGEGQARYVALRVNNHPKVKLEKVFDAGAASGDALVKALTRIATALEKLAEQK